MQYTRASAIKAVKRYNSRPNRDYDAHVQPIYKAEEEYKGEPIAYIIGYGQRKDRNK